MVERTSSCVRVLTSSGTVNLNFLLILYLPTLPKSYLLGSKNLLCRSCWPPETEGGSPGRNFL